MPPGGEPSPFGLGWWLAPPITGQDALSRGETMPPMQPSRVVVGLDSQSRRLGIADALSLHGYDVRSAFDGEAVLELAQSWSADSAVIELSIPGMPAFEVGREIRRRVGRKVRLVGMTT